MKLAAVVIAFDYPNEQLYENVKKYIEFVDLMIIWDNTPQERTKIRKEFWLNQKTRTILLSTGNNEGIGYALNRAIECARENGCTHLLTMDQDSIWRDFKSYKTTIENNEEKNVAIHAPTIADANSDFVFRCNKPDLYAITSGSVLNLEFVNYIGMFNENFFIDEVDNEYCIRVVKAGYHIKIYKDHFLYQHFGEGGKSIFGKGSRGNYSAFRTYYQVRNRIWMWRLYPHDLSYKYHLRTVGLTILQRLWIILISENSKSDKARAIWKGIWHGLTKSPKGEL